MREFVENESIIIFWSRGTKPFQNLSNFALIPDGIEYDGIIYPSVEHAFQAQKVVKEQRNEFSVDGRFGKWESLKLLIDNKLGDDKKEKEYRRLYSYWSAKNNIGIIAKKLSSKINMKKLEIQINDKFESTNELWLGLLEKKFAIKYFADILKNTGDLYLLEYDSNRFNSIKNFNSFWAGRIINNKLYGNNQMGKYLMEIRKLII